MTPTEQIKERIAALQDSLTNAHPKLPVLLREIHTTLRKDPDLVTALEDQEIASIIAALKKQTATEIITKVTSKPSGKSLKNITLLDL